MSEKDDLAIEKWQAWLDEKEVEYRIAGVDAPNLDALWEAASSILEGDPDPPDEWIRIPRWVLYGLVYSLSLLKTKAPKKRTKTRGRPRKDRPDLSPLEAAQDYAIHFPRWIAVRRELRRGIGMEKAREQVSDDIGKSVEAIRDSYDKIEFLRNSRFK